MTRRGGLVRPALAFVLALGLATGLGCKSDGSGFENDPLLQLSAEEALAEGEALLVAEKYRRAQDYLTHAYEVEPNSPTGRTALLLAADALFLSGGRDDLVRAEAKYRDFQNRFPTSDKGPYVLFQIARSLKGRMLKPDRDQGVTRKAIEAYEEVMLVYPTSDYATQAREDVVEVKARLAESEFLVGHFYFRTRRYLASADRLEEVVETYPDYPRLDEVLFFLGSAYQRSEQPDMALATFSRLRDDFPQSEYIEKIPEVKRKAAAVPDPGDPGDPDEAAPEAPESEGGDSGGAA